MIRNSSRSSAADLVLPADIIRRVAIHEVVRNNGAPFRGALTMRCAGAIRIMRFATTPIDIVPRVEHVGGDSDDIAVLLCASGAVDVVHESRRVSLAAGEAMLFDSAVASRLAITQPSRLWLLMIARMSIVCLGGSPRRRLQDKLHHGTNLQLLFGYL